MTNRWLRWSALFALILVLGAAAPAQTPLEEGLLRARFGAFFPAEDEFQALSDNWFSFGLTYEIPYSLIGVGTTELSLDFYLRDLRGSRGTVTSLIYNQVFAQSAGDETYSIRLRLGVGLYAVDAIGPSKNLIGARVGVTFQFDPAFSLEANYDFTDRFGSPGVRANGLSVMLGYQF